MHYETMQLYVEVLYLGFLFIYYYYSWSYMIEHT